MLQDNGLLRGTAYVRYVHEVLFSANLAFLCVSILFAALPNSIRLFLQLEFALNKLFHIPQTDFIRGYFAFATSSIILALCVWLFLRYFAHARIAEQTLRWLAGLAAVFGPAAYWVFIYQLQGWPFGWPYRWAPVELLVALICLFLYLHGKWPFPRWTSLLLLAGHYVFWYYVPSTNHHAPNYGGPIAPITAFGSAVAWATYVAGSRKNLREQMVN